jgi:hypothetical protein
MPRIVIDYLPSGGSGARKRRWGDDDQILAQ